MSAPVVHEAAVGPRSPDAAAILAMSGAAWFTVAVAGQWLFAIYVAVFYGSAALGGAFERWNDVLVGGYVRGGLIGNAILASHLALAVVITMGGALQLLPSLRARLPALHRLNGRVYLLMAIIVSVGGLYMVWTRGTAGGFAMRVGISLNGVLIVAAAWLAWRYVRARRFDLHRRWAMRLFVLVSGVWFFRVGMMLWILANRGPVGMGGEGFDGPTVRILAFACYLLPLAILEVYLRAQSSPAASTKLAASGLIILSTLATAVGVFGATVGLWAPRIIG